MCWVWEQSTIAKPSISWLTETVSLYGKPVALVYQCFQFYWDSPTEKVLFVLTQQPCGKQMIVLSSDLSLSGLEVIEAYTKRFKIEVAFRTLVHLLGGFAYRFWLEALDKIADWPDSMHLLDYRWQRRKTTKRQH